MRRILVPLSLGLGATRHLIWYLSYQMTGDDCRDGESGPSNRG
jgi:hypothetical protein